LLSQSSTSDISTSSTFNISSDDSLTINQIVEIIKTTVSEKFEVVKTESRLSDNSAIDLDNSKIKKAIPSFKFTPIAKGIAGTYSYIKTHSQKQN